MYATYNITTDTWSTAALLYNLNYEILPAAFNYTTNFTETDVQVTVQEGKFVITWERNQVGLYRIWTPTAPDNAPVIFTDTSKAINYARLVTYGSGTNTDPHYTVFIYRNNPRNKNPDNPDTVVVSLTLMEPGNTSFVLCFLLFYNNVLGGTYTFGSVISYDADENYPMTYQDILLAPSLDYDLKTPSIVQVFALNYVCKFNFILRSCILKRRSCSIPSQIRHT